MSAVKRPLLDIQTNKNPAIGAGFFVIVEIVSRDFPPLDSARDDRLEMTRSRVLCHSDQGGGISKRLYIAYAMNKTLGTHNYYVYILTNRIKTVLYIGVTNDLKTRLYYHNNPEANSKHFTHKYRCKYLIYFEHFQDVNIAILREKQLKNWKRDKKERLITEVNPYWKDLYNTI